MYGPRVAVRNGHTSFVSRRLDLVCVMYGCCISPVTAIPSRGYCLSILRARRVLSCGCCRLYLLFSLFFYFFLLQIPSCLPTLCFPHITNQRSKGCCCTYHMCCRASLLLTLASAVICPAPSAVRSCDVMTGGDVADFRHYGSALVSRSPGVGAGSALQ